MQPQPNPATPADGASALQKTQRPGSMRRALVLLVSAIVVVAVFNALAGLSHAAGNVLLGPDAGGWSANQPVAAGTPTLSPGNWPAAPVKQVQAITQAQANAGYDSPEQYHRWWDSACSAAVLAEVLRAWGLSSVTIGQTLDLLIAARAISPDQGLFDQDAWDTVAQHYHLRGDQRWNRSYGDIVHLVEEQGLPVVANVRDSNHRYFPAFDTGHYLVVVGASASGVSIVDSSLYRIHYLTLAVFKALWSGQTILIAPQELLP